MFPSWPVSGHGAPLDDVSPYPSTSGIKRIRTRARNGDVAEADAEAASVHLVELLLTVVELPDISSIKEESASSPRIIAFVEASKCQSLMGIFSFACQVNVALEQYK